MLSIKTFTAIDSDGNGLLSISEVKNYLQSNENELTMKTNEIESICKDMDMNNDGVVTFEEFVIHMMNHYNKH